MKNIKSIAAILLGIITALPIALTLNLTAARAESPISEISYLGFHILPID